MIRFSQVDPGLARIAALIQQKRAADNLAVLFNSLYVFGANADRELAVYLSPHILMAHQMAAFLNANGVPTIVEAIAEPAQQQWIAFHRKQRANTPELCARVCLFVEHGINNLILW